jgi:deoxycytidylate deaminase
MPLDPQALVIGLTGPFGSGCSTVANVLGHLTPPFTTRKLSDEVRAAWTGEEAAARHDLQALGDKLRSEHGGGYLASEAVHRLEEDHVTHKRVAIDGIRNTGEIKFLRDRFGDRFFLFAIFAPADVRWERVRDAYVKREQDEQDFLADDRRDANEETPHGQQVELCVDQSDVFLRNSMNLSALQLGTTLKEKVSEYVDLVTRVAPRYPTLDEVLMNVAFSAAHSTRCLKRQVGAVIATERGEPISVGYNENPDKILPCVDEFGECYRDRIRNEHFFNLAESKTVCPSCGEKIEQMIGPPWRCAKCSANLERYFFPDRAMKWCTALHAEERAIINAQGRSLEGSAIYTTAFPCFLCAEKILQAGITRIVFADPYPDIYSAELIEHAEPAVEVERFEGVRSGSFDRIFGGVRERKEAEVNAKRQEALGAITDAGGV